MLSKVARDSAVKASAVAGVVVAAGTATVAGRWPLVVAALVTAWAALTVVAVVGAARR